MPLFEMFASRNPYCERASEIYSY